MVNKFPCHWNTDPEPLSKKGWLVLATGAALGVLGFFTPIPINGVFFVIGYFSLNIAYCAFDVLMVDPIGGTRWEKEKAGRENLPKYFAIFSVSFLFVLITLCAIM